MGNLLTNRIKKLEEKHHIGNRYDIMSDDELNQRIIELLCKTNGHALGSEYHQKLLIMRPAEFDSLFRKEREEMWEIMYGDTASGTTE